MNWYVIEDSGDESPLKHVAYGPFKTQEHALEVVDSLHEQYKNGDKPERTVCLVHS